MAKRVDVRFEGSETVSKAAKKSQGAIHNVNKAVKDSKKIWQNSTIAIGAAIAAFYGITRVVGELVDAYREQEQAEAKLRSAILATGRGAEVSADALIAYAGELQRITTFGDEATISAMAMLQSLADLSEDGFRQITPLIQDFAIGMSVDLETAASLVGKTLGSTTNALSRYGIQIDATASQEEKLAQLTAELESKFGGMAQAAADTATGSMVQLQNAFGDLKEYGGKLVAEGLAPTARWLTTLIERFLKGAEAAGRFWEQMRGGVEEVEDKQAMLEDLRERYAELTAEIEALEAAEQKRTRGGRGGMIRSTEAQVESLRKARELLQEQISTLEVLIQKENALVVAGSKTLTIFNDRATALEFIREEYEKTSEAAQEAAAAQLEQVVALLDFWKAVHPEEQETIRMLEAIADRLWGLLPPLEAVKEESEQIWGGWASAPSFEGMEFVSAPGVPLPAAEPGAAGPSGVALMAINAAMETFGRIEAVSQLLDPFTTALSVTVDLIGEDLQAALEPLVGILKVLGHTLGIMLKPVIQVLTPILEAVGKAFVWLYNKVLRPVGNVLITVFGGIANFFISAINGIIWLINLVLPKKRELSYLSKIDVSGSKLGEISYQDLLPSEEEPRKDLTGIGSSTTIQRVPDIYIYQTFQGHIIGAGGMREFGEFTARALEEYAGIGGRIRIEEATV